MKATGSAGGQATGRTNPNQVHPAKPVASRIMSVISFFRSHRPRPAAPSRAAHPRRVLHVITPSHMSGAETQLVRLTRRLRARGHEMPVLVKHGSPAVAEMLARDFPVETARIGGKANLLAMSAISRAARKHGSELLHTHL